MYAAWYVGEAWTKADKAVVSGMCWRTMILSSVGRVSRLGFFLLASIAAMDYIFVHC